MITQAVGYYCVRSALTVVHHSGLGLQAGFFFGFFFWFFRGYERPALRSEKGGKGGFCSGA